MSSNNERLSKVIGVAISLCLVCSIVVSASAVLLRDAQQANQALDIKRNILAAAGELNEQVSVEEQFRNVEIRAVDLDTGKFTDAVDVDSYNQTKAAKDPAMSERLTAAEDHAKVGRREKYALVYLFREGDQLDKVVLPVKGAGLWSTLYGFLALEADLNTVAGLGFYDHAETPGLGGEVDNPLWKNRWPGKKVYGDDQDVRLTVLKGAVDGSRAEAVHQVDGLSGATLTTRGVDGMIQFWMGENGYAKFLSNLKSGEA
ncbi:MAG: Na(+)-translocating NADH-quinone reductase subunit C [Porticoccaceae bacterium]|nr:Na(+)-translocating NADH-quinone reductase subunit C [Porticoccaceae bacterium]